MSYVSYLLQPHILLHLVTALAILNLWRKRRETPGRLLWVTVPFVALTVFCLPAVSYLAVGSLEWRHPPQLERPADIEAVVVLGSGTLAPDAVRPRAELDGVGLARCLHASELYHQGPPCPILICGGKPDPSIAGPACASLMRDYLIQLGVPASDIHSEGESRNTYENARACRQLLEQHQLGRVALVTDSFHMARAWACFKKQGIDAVPCACSHRATEWQWEVKEFLPSLSAADDCQLAAHEWIGMAWYWVRGRI